MNWFKREKTGYRVSPDGDSLRSQDTGFREQIPLSPIPYPLYPKQRKPPDFFLFIIFLAFFAGLFLLKADILHSVPVSFSSGGAQVNWATATPGVTAVLPIAAGYDVYDSKDAGIAAGTDIRIQSTSYTATDDGTLTTTGSATGGGFLNGTNSSTTVSGTGTNSSIILSSMGYPTGVIVEERLIRQNCTGYSNCYTSLSAWEDGEDGAANRNLVTENKIAVAKIDGPWTAADTTAVTIDGWTTDATHYIKIYTTPEARHNGKWDNNKYQLTVNGDAIINNVNYVTIDGLQIDISRTTATAGSAIAVGFNSMIISNNILRQSIAGSVAGRGLYFVSNSKIFNNIIYGFEWSGMILHADSANIYVYNNTVYNCGEGSSGNSGNFSILKNNISYNNTDNYVGNFNASSTNNLSGPAQTDAPGTNPKNATTVTFVDATSGDYHLNSTDTGAKNAGADLSADSIAFNTDIDGHFRSGTWDIGAHEEGATTIPSSSGAFESATIDLGGLVDFSTLSWNPAAQSAGTNLSFEAAANNDNATWNYLPLSDEPYPAGVTVETRLIRQNCTGYSNCYTSLSAWEDGEDGAANRNLVTENKIAVAKIDGPWTVADTVYVTIDGWTTDATHYIKIYTTPEARHNGKWDTGKYRLEPSVDGNALHVQEAYTRIEGLQVAVTPQMNSDYRAGIILLGQTNGDASGSRISHNIIKNTNVTNSFLKGIVTPVDILGSVYIFNNIVYDFNTTSNVAIVAYSDFVGVKHYVYNNTVINCTKGYEVADDGVLKNNIAQSCTDGFDFWVVNASDYNISDLASDAPGANSKNSTTVSFVDAANKDFHLTSGDTAAKNAGADLSADANLAVKTDILGRSRPTGAGAVDIGAHEEGATATPVTGYIPDNLDDNRYLRYKAYLAAADTTYTPGLNDITVNYSMYPVVATLTSSKFDTGAANSFIKSLAWSEAGVTAAKDVKLQVSAAATSGAIGTFCGPRDGTDGSCTAATYFTDPAGSEQIDDLQIPGRWFQYKGFLTSDGTGTATLDNINVTYDTVSFQLTSSGGGSVNAGTAYPVTIKAMDTQATPAAVTGYDGSKTLAFTGMVNSPEGAAPKISDDNICGDADDMNPASAILTFASGVADPPGAETNYYLCLLKAEAATISATASSGAIPTTTPLNVTVNALATSGIYFTQQPASTGTVEAPFTTQPIVKVTDTYGNPKSGVTVDLSDVLASDDTTTGAGSLTGTTSLATNASGLATFTNVGYTKTDTIHIKAAVVSPALSAASTTNIILSGGAAATLTVSGITDPVAAGVLSNVTVTAKDTFGNTATGYTGTVAFTSSDAQAALPVNYTFLAGDNGVKIFTNGVTMKTVGERTVTATDTVTGTITGTQSAITVTPGPTKQIVFTTTSQSVAAGVVSGVMTVQARDAYGNTNTADVSSVSLVSTSPTMKFDTSSGGAFDGTITAVTLAAGEKSFYFKDTTSSATATISLSLAQANILQTSDTGTGDTPNAGGFNAGTKTGTGVNGGGTAASVKLMNSSNVNEYTIGALANITVTASAVSINSAGGWVVTFGATDFSRIFKNDRFTDSAAKKWKILSVFDSVDKIIVVDSENNGGTPATGAGNVGRWYASISAWEAGREGDLIARNAIERGLPYYDVGPDTTAVIIDGWTTDAAHYIEIYVPLSERHRGQWDTGKYALVVANVQGAIRVNEDYVRIDGLQMSNSCTIGCGSGILNYATIPGGDVRITNNIIKKTGGAGNNSTGVGAGGANLSGKWTIANNIIYDFYSGILIANNDNSSFIIYNNTVIDSANRDFSISLYAASDTLSLYNNIAQGAPTNYAFFNSATTYTNGNNISSDATSPNASYRSKTVSFVDSANDDFHIAFNDTAAKNAGADLSADANFPITTDIDNDARSGTWDIGADDVGATLVMTHSIGTASRDFSTLQAWEDARDGVLTTRNVFKIASQSAAFTEGETITGTSGATGTYIKERDTPSASETYMTVDKINGTAFVAGDTLTGAGGSTATLSTILTASGTIEKGEAYKDSTFTAGITIDGSTTDTNHYMWLTAEPGSRHKGVWDTSASQISASVAGSCVLCISDPYTRIESLQIENTHTGANSTVVYTESNFVKIIGNIGRTASSDDTSQVFLVRGAYGPTESSYVFNNIGIHRRTQSAAFGADGSNIVYFYNNTAITSAIGFALAYNYQDVINNLAYITSGTGQMFYNSGGTWSSASNYNISSDATAPGAGSLTNKAVADLKFVSTAAGMEDFHIMNGSAAIDMGADLSATFKNDIDAGQTRPSANAFDIGADELIYAPSYQSSGTFESATLDLASAQNLGTITWNPAAQPAGTTVDVKVAAKNTDSGWTDADFSGISASAASYPAGVTVEEMLIKQDCTGYTAGTCYTSLSAWEAAKNTDLVAANKIAVAKIDGAWTVADTTAVTIDGWTTDSTHYIRIYTTAEARHNGKWDTGKYRLETAGNTYNPVLNIIEDYVRIDGLQIYNTSTTNQPSGLMMTNSASTGGEFIISNNIVRFSPSFSSDYQGGISTNTAGACVNSNTVVKIYNNIIYDAYEGIRLGTLGSTQAATHYIYNNTIINPKYKGISIGFYGPANTNAAIKLKNNLVQGANTNFSTYQTNLVGLYETSNNLSQDATSPNTSLQSKVVSFVDLAGADYRLAFNDTAAKNAGADLSADANFSFNTDIEGHLRSTAGVWDIGAHEQGAVGGNVLTTLGAKELAGTESGLVGLWHMNAVTGNQISDSSPNGNTGTLGATTATAADDPTLNTTSPKLGAGALSFDGVDDKVSLGTSLDISALPFAVTAWVNPTNYSGWRPIFCKRDTWASNDMRFELQLDNITGRVRLLQFADVKNFNYSPPMGQWTHLAVIANSTGTTLYVNGQSKETLGVFTLGTDAAAAVSIGRPGDGGDAFLGLLDEVAVFNRALSAAEIKAMYDGAASRYLRYKVTLTTSDTSVTPQVDDISIGNSLTSVQTNPVTPAAASYFTVTSATATPTAGTSFNVTLTAKDSFGNTATGYSAAGKTFTLSGPGNAPIGTVPAYGTNASIVAAFVNGAATIPVTLYNRETVSLDVSDGTLNSAGNAAYDADLVVGAAAASKLIYTQQPPALGLSNTAFSTQPIVQIQDQYNNVCTTGADAALTVALAAVNPGDGTTVLTGALTNGSMAASGGVATFSGLAYNQAEPLKLRASSGALTTALSNQVTVVAFDVTTPAGGAVWAAGSTQTIQWTIYGATAPFTVQYWNGTGWFDVRDAANAPAVAVSGTTQQWKIPVNMTISSSAKVRIFENAAPGLPAESGVFSISGGLTLNQPVAGAKWAIGTAHDIIWTEFGTFGSGVKLEYYDGAIWKPVTGGGADNAGIAGTLVSTNADGSLTKRFSWTPSSETGMAAGYTTANIRVSDANTSNPPVSAASGTFTIAGMAVNYTPPDRGNTAARVGATAQTVSWTHAGAGFVKLQYYSPLATGYVTIPGATALAAGASGGSFAWTVPDDVGVGNVLLKAIAVGADGTEAASAIEGSVSGVLGTAFTIYGTLTLTSTYNGTAYSVDSATNRVPVTWTGSVSIPGVVFEYATSNSTPVYTAITSVQGDFYTTSTGTTLGVNWAAGTGSAYWQPKVTGSTFWLRLKDSADVQTVSALGAAADYFGVSGVSVSSVVPASPFSAGQAVTVNGAGAGAVTVGVFYAGSLADAQNKTGTIGSIGVAAVAGNDTFTTPWTVPDLIGNTVYLRVENTANPAVFNVAGPYTIKGNVTITNPTVTDWVVGDTTQDISGTVTGDIDSITLQYATTAVPVENDWIDLTPAAVSIGNHFGTTAAAWTLTDAFTVPDVISASFKLRAVDGTFLRAASLLAKSAAMTNTVTTRGALTVSTPGAAWIVGAPATVNWTAKGSLGNIIVEYQSSTDNNLDPWSTFSTVTASVASTGAGTSAVAGSYAWNTVADVVAAEVGASAVQSDPDVFMRVKVTSVSDPTVTATSAAFVVRYRAITWRILDANGNMVTGLNVSEAATTNPAKPAFNVTANTFSGNNTVRYYPDNTAVTTDSYTTLFDRAEAGTTYSTSSAGWRADSDKTITLAMDTAATAAISYTTEINAVYDATNDAIAISSWLTKKGVQVSDLTSLNASSISVHVYDTNGTQLNALDLGAGKTPNAQGIYTGIVYDPAAGLDASQTYTLKATISYNNAQYTGVSGFVSPSVFSYTAQIGAIYNNANDSIMANIWLERSGTTVTDPGDMTFQVFSGTGTAPLNGAGGQTFDGYDTTTDTVKDAALISGIYTAIEYNPAGVLDSALIYTIKADIVYRGRTYNAVASFSKGELGAIQSDIAGIQTGQTAQTATLQSSITGQTTTLQGSIAGQTSTLQSSITGQTATLQGSIAGQTTTLGNQIGSVGANVTALPTTVSNAVTSSVTTAVTADMAAQLARGIQAELLTRPTNVATGTTIPIRFRTATGLSPKITVYDPNNTARISAAAMTEISTTGIYEYKLTLNTAWGLGDFTVLVTESTRGSTDSLILHVGLGGMDEIYSKVSGASATTGSSAGVSLDTIFAGVTSIQTNTNGLNNDIAALLSRLGKATDGAGAASLFGKIAAIDTSSGKEDAILKGVDDIKSYVDTVESSLGSDADTKGSGTIFARLAQLDDLMKTLGSGSKEVEAAKARAMNLAALMEEIRADLAGGDMADASAKLAALGQGLSALNSDLNGLPAAAGEASVGGAFEDLKEMAAGGGLEGLVPLLEEIKKGREAFNPENMTQMRNTVEELKSLMTEVRALLDQEVNKPVVHGWLEEEQE